jgi:segregation and condensation protein B
MPTAPTPDDTPEWVKGDLPPEPQAPPADAAPLATPAPPGSSATNGGPAERNGAPVIEHLKHSEDVVRSADAAADDAVAEEQLPAEPPSATAGQMDGARPSAERRQSDLDQRPQVSAEAALSPQTAGADHRAQMPDSPQAGLRSSAELAFTAGPHVDPKPIPAPPHSIEALIPNPLSLEAQVESLLFVADGAVPLGRLAEALEVSNREIEAALAGLSEDYRQRGLSLQRFHDKVQLTTSPAAASRVERFLGLAAATPLSRAALETLAIVAYQQPVTRPQIEAVRGVNSDSVIKNLLGKGLIEDLGRAEGPGRPVLYSTTPEFMQHFGLASLSDLPPLSLSSPDGSLRPELILKG